MAYKTPSVWHEEVNAGLIEYAKKYVKCHGNGGTIITPPVMMRKPDEELKKQNFPCITFYNTMDLRNVYRTDNIPHYHKDDNRVVEYYLPLPIDMYYQVDFWAEHWGQIDEMSKAWQQSLPPFSSGKFFNLPVVDSNGNKVTVLCLEKDILRRRDTLTEGMKTLHSTIVYSIQGYLGRDYPDYDNIIEKIDLSVEREV